jgi:hypothetical protein
MAARQAVERPGSDKIGLFVCNPFSTKNQALVCTLSALFCKCFKIRQICTVLESNQQPSD